MKNITVANKSFGKFSGVRLFLTESLFDKLSKEKTKRDKTPILDLLKTGKALRGLKHLIESIKSVSDSNQLVFTDEGTHKTDNKYFVNYGEYRRIAGSRFFSLYRATGLDAARYYLNKYFPEEFDYSGAVLTDDELKKAGQNFPDLLRELSEKAKHKKILIRRTSDVLVGLREEKKVLSKDIADLKELRRQSSISYYQQRYDELVTRLTKRYPETKGGNSWQQWIYSNSWVFGAAYQKPIQKEQVGFDNIPDYLFPTLDGFIDILEIKRPDVDVIKKDESHTGSYRWAPVVNEAIGQVVNYIHEIELHQLEIQQNLKRAYPSLFRSSIFTIKPRAIILAGNSENWDESRKEALRKLNYSLHGIEILTYFDILQRVEKIISMYSENYD